MLKKSCNHDVSLAPCGVGDTFRNQLEPLILVQSFLRHPPVGFGVVNIDQYSSPAFTVQFDLLTTVDPSLKKKMARLPFFKLWSRLLTLKTAFVGCTTSEYMYLPKHLNPKDWLSLILSQCANSYTVTILKDVPSYSPLLSAEDNVQSALLIELCKTRGALVIDGQALAYVPIDFVDVNAYLARLSSSRRKDIRRKLRARQALEIRVINTGDTYFSKSDVLHNYYLMYLNVYRQSEVHFDCLGFEFFVQLLQNTSGVVFEYSCDAQVIGFNLCFIHNNNLVDKYIGFHYPQARKYNLYYISWIVNLEYAIEHKLNNYIAGWTDPKVKAQLGARFTLSRHVVFVKNPILRKILSCLSRFFESDSLYG